MTSSLSCRIMVCMFLASFCVGAVLGQCVDKISDCASYTEKCLKFPEWGKYSCQHTCNLCPAVNGDWGAWTPYGSCTVTCGTGTQQRNRECDNPAPANGGSSCAGLPTDTRMCTPRSCPINGDWGAWTPYGSCTVTCGTGTQQRNRECDNPAPANGGSSCAGLPTDTRMCTPRSCPINGDWGAWTPYGSCTVTCGTGTQQRTRECDNPAPANGGSSCAGLPTDTRMCTPRSCPKYTCSKDDERVCLLKAICILGKADYNFEGFLLPNGVTSESEFVGVVFYNSDADIKAYFTKHCWKVTELRYNGDVLVTFEDPQLLKPNITFGSDKMSTVVSNLADYQKTTFKRHCINGYMNSFSDPPIHGFIHLPGVLQPVLQPQFPRHPFLQTCMDNLEIEGTSRHPFNISSTTDRCTTQVFRLSYPEACTSLPFVGGMPRGQVASSATWTVDEHLKDSNCSHNATQHQYVIDKSSSDRHININERQLRPGVNRICNTFLFSPTFQDTGGNDVAYGPYSLKVCGFVRVDWTPCLRLKPAEQVTRLFLGTTLVFDARQTIMDGTQASDYNFIWTCIMITKSPNTSCVINAENKPELTFKPIQALLNMEIEITLKVTFIRAGSTTGQPARTSRRVEVISPSLKVSVKCQANCKDKRISVMVVVLDGVCSSCNGLDLNYKWTMNETTSGNSSIPILGSELKRLVQSGMTSRGFVLRAAGNDLLERVFTVCFTATVTGTNTTFERRGYGCQKLNFSGAPRKKPDDKCLILPMSGQPGFLATKFTGLCFWTNDTGLVYKLFTYDVGLPEDQRTLDLIAFSDISRLPNLELPFGNPDHDFELGFVFWISNKDGQTYIFNVTELFKTKDVVFRVPKPADYKYLDKLYEVTESVQERGSSSRFGSRQGVINVAGIVGKIIGQAKEDKVNIFQPRKLTKIRENLLTALAGLTDSDANTIQQVTPILDSLTSVPEEISDKAETKGAETLMALTEGLPKFVDQDLQTGVKMSRSLLKVLEQLVARSVKRQENFRKYKNASEESITESDDRASNYTTMFMNIGAGMVAATLQPDNPTVDTHGKSAVVVKWTKVTNTTELVGDLPRSNSNRDFQTFIKVKASSVNITEGTEVDILMTVTEKNLFMIGKGAENVNMPMVNFELRNRDTKTTIVAPSLAEPVDIFIQRKETEELLNTWEWIRINLTEADVGNASTVEQPVLSPTVSNETNQVKIPANQTLGYRLLSEKKIFLNASVDNAIVVRFNCSHPSVTFTLSATFVNTSGGCMSVFQHVEYPRQSGLKTVQNKTQKPDVVFLPRINASDEGGRYELLVSVTSQTPPLLYTEKTAPHLMMLQAYLICQTRNTSSSAWESFGCEVTDVSSFELLHCRCSHLSIFSGGILVAPKPLDMDLGLFKNFFKNPAIVSVVAFIWCLYFVIVYWAREEDWLDSFRSRVAVLEDNNVHDKWAYLVCAVTGWWINSGTTAKVFIYIKGRRGMSRVHRLTDDEQTLFVKGAENWFIITSPHRLGKIDSVVVWHDSSGSSPAWFLKEVYVQDIRSGVFCHCMYNDWISVEHGEGHLCVEIPALEPEEIHRKTMYQTILKTSLKLRNSHLWLSIFLKPCYSPFTRVQRVTCALCLLLTTMLANLMFFGLPKGDGSDQVQTLPIRINTRPIIIGIQCSLMLMPVNMLLVQLFARTSNKIKHQQYPTYDVKKEKLLTIDNDEAEEGKTEEETGDEEEEGGEETSDEEEEGGEETADEEEEGGKETADEEEEGGEETADEEEEGGEETADEEEEDGEQELGSHSPPSCRDLPSCNPSSNDPHYINNPETGNSSENQIFEVTCPGAASTSQQYSTADVTIVPDKISDGIKPDPPTGQPLKLVDTPGLPVGGNINNSAGSGGGNSKRSERTSQDGQGGKSNLKSRDCGSEPKGPSSKGQPQASPYECSRLTGGLSFMKETPWFKNAVKLLRENVARVVEDGRCSEQTFAQKTHSQDDTGRQAAFGQQTHSPDDIGRQAAFGQQTHSPDDTGRQAAFGQQTHSPDDTGRQAASNASVSYFEQLKARRRGCRFPLGSLTEGSAPTLTRLDEHQALGSGEVVRPSPTDSFRRGHERALIRRTSYLDKLKEKTERWKREASSKMTTPREKPTTTGEGDSLTTSREDPRTTAEGDTRNSAASPAHSGSGDVTIVETEEKQESLWAVLWGSGQQKQNHSHTKEKPGRQHREEALRDGAGSGRPVAKACWFCERVPGQEQTIRQLEAARKRRSSSESKAGSEGVAKENKKSWKARAKDRLRGWKGGAPRRSREDGERAEDIPFDTILRHHDAHYDDFQQQGPRALKFFRRRAAQCMAEQYLSRHSNLHRDTSTSNSSNTNTNTNANPRTNTKTNTNINTYTNTRTNTNNRTNTSTNSVWESDDTAPPQSSRSINVNMNSSEHEDKFAARPLTTEERVSGRNAAKRKMSSRSTADLDDEQEEEDESAEERSEEETSDSSSGHPGDCRECCNVTCGTVMATFLCHVCCQCPGGSKAPWWALYVTWTLAMGVALTSSFVVMMYGLQLGYQGSVDWLSVFFTGFLNSVFVMQPFKVVVVSLLSVFILKKHVNIREESGVKVEDDDNNLLHKQVLKQYEIRKRMLGGMWANSDYVYPIPRSKAKDIKLRLEQDARARRILKESILWVLFLLAVTVACQGHTPVSEAYHVNSVVKNMLQNAHYVQGGIPLDDVDSTETLWDYITLTVLPTLLTNHTLTDASITSQTLGNIRLRQVRELPGNEMCAEEMGHIYSSFLTKEDCLPDGAFLQLETGSFNHSWEVPANRTRVDQGDGLARAWRFQSSRQLGEVTLWGKRVVYPGSGYAITLPSNHTAAKALVDQLRDMDWLDMQSRGAVVELNLYTPSKDLITSTQIFCERFAEGNMDCTLFLHTVKLQYYMGTYENAITFAEFFWLVMTAVNLYYEMQDLIVLGFDDYIRSGWVWLEGATFLLSLLAAGLQLARVIVTDEFLDNLSDANYNGYFSFATTRLIDQVQDVVKAVVFVLMMIKVFRILRYNKHFRILLQSLYIAGTTILNHTVVVFMLLMGFGSAAYVLFVAHIESFRGLGTTLLTFLLFSCRIEIDLPAMQAAHSILGPLLFFLFFFLFNCIAISLFVAFVLESHNVAKAFVKLNADDQHVIDYVLRVIRLKIGASQTVRKVRRLRRTHPFKAASFNQQVDRQVLPTLWEI